MTTAPSVPQRQSQSTTVAHLIAERQHGSGGDPTLHAGAIGTGFGLLDRLLGGGLRAGDLALLAGGPGVGKTIAALQWARNMAHTGHDVVYVCYEHDAAVLLARLIAMEMGLAAPADASGVERAAEDVRRALLDGRPLAPLVERSSTLATALNHIDAYAANLHLVRGSGAYTDITALRQFLDNGFRSPVLFVDYLQKVAVHPEPDNETEKVLRIAEALKDLALSAHVPVIAVAAAASAGLEAQRLRMHHLRGSSALGYECDVGIVMNEKYDIVSKAHVAFDTVRAAAFRRAVVFSVEKNRGGPAHVDIEFQKHFSAYRFDADGQYVAERLIDERITAE